MKPRAGCGWGWQLHVSTVKIRNQRCGALNFQILGHLMGVARKVAAAEKLDKGYRIVINDGAAMPMRLPVPA